MTAIAPLIVQLVHIQGPLKGEIQELSDTQISIGRHPECQVQFPKDLVTLSRRHAMITREGNRFKLIDQSTNGTYVNGQRVNEAYLKDGDVITLAPNGPKLSFLTRIDDQPAGRPQAQPAGGHAAIPGQAPQPPAPHSAVPDANSMPSQPPALHSQTRSVAQSPQPASNVTVSAPSQAAAPQPGCDIPIESTKVPFAIQYGPALKSYHALPITLGKGGQCDFTINHPSLNDQQALVFFYQDRYWIKDLTGTQAVSVDGLPCNPQAALQPNAQVALSPRGPKFRFLGGGRLAQVEDPLPVNTEPTPQAAPSEQAKPETPDRAAQKAGGLFKKFFS